MPATLETKTCRSGFLAVRMHYSIDPENWTPERIAKIRAAIPGWRWLKEYEIDFGARGGQKVYDNFDPLVHVRADGPDLGECLKYKVIDHGRRNPTACLWFAEDRQTHTVYFYREYYRPDATIAEHCRAIHDLEPSGETRLTLIDPATHRRLDNAAATIADEYARNGIVTLPADNALAPGLETVSAALNAALARWSLKNQRRHPWFESHALPAREIESLAAQRAVYFHPALTHTIRELSQLAWDASADDDPRRPLCEKISAADDHAADCVRYALRRPWTQTQGVRSHLRKS